MGEIRSGIKRCQCPDCGQIHIMKGQKLSKKEKQTRKFEANTPEEQEASFGKDDEERSCKYCSEFKGTRKGYREHVIDEHLDIEEVREAYEKSQPKKEKKYFYTCDYCDFRDDDEEVVRKHEMEQHAYEKMIKGKE